MKKHERRSSILGLGGGKDIIKCQFDIVIKQVSGLPKSTTTPIFFQWKRGTKKENSGQCPPATLNDEREANFNYNFSLICTLHKDPKKGFEEKNLVFDLREDKPKKSSSLGKVPINLAEFAISRSERIRTFSIRDKKSAVASVILSFKTTWLKMNGKKLVKATEANSQGGNVVQLDGNDYYLQTDTEDVSIADDKSDSDAEDAETFNDDDEVSKRASLRLAPITESSLANIEKDLPPPVATPRAVEPTPAPIPAPTPATAPTPASVPAPTPATPASVPTSSPASASKSEKKADKSDKSDKSAEEKARKYKKKCKAMIKDLADLKKENEQLKADVKQKEAASKGGSADQQAKIDELNKKITANEASEKELRAKLTALEAQIAASGDKDKQIATLKSESKDIEEGLRKKVKEVTDKQTESQRELEKKTKALQDAEKRIKEIEKGSSALDTLKSANLDLQARLDIMEVTNEQKEKETQAQITQLTAQLETAKKSAADQEKRSADAAKGDEAQKTQVKKLEDELAAAKKEAEAAKKESTDIKKEVETAKKESTDAKKEVADVKKEAEAAKKESADIKKEVEAAKKESADAKKEAEAAKKDAEAAKKEIKEAQAKHTVLIADFDKSKGDLASKDAEVVKLDAEVVKLRAQLAEVQSNAEANEAQAGATAELEGKVKELQEKVDKKADKKRRLKKQLAMTNADVEEMNKKIAELEEKEDEFDKLTVKVKVLEAQLNDTERSVDESAEIKMRVEELELRNRKLEEEAKKNSKTHSEQLEASKSRVTELETQNKSLNTKIADLESQNKTLSTKVNDLEAKNKSATSKTSELEAQNKSLSMKITELADQNKLFVGMVAGLEKELESARAGEQNSKAAADKDYQKKISKLEEELASVTHTSENLREELMKENNRANELEKQNSELEEKLAKAKEKKKDDSDEESDEEDLQQQIEELEDEIDSLKQKVNRKTTEIEILEEEKSDLQKRITEFETHLASPPTSKRDQKKLSALEEERDTLQRRVAELESQSPHQQPRQTPSDSNNAELEDERDELLIRVKELEILQSKNEQKLVQAEEDKVALERELVKHKALAASPQGRRSATPDDGATANGDESILAKIEAAVYWPEVGFGSSSHEGNTATAIIQLLNNSHAFENPTSHSKALVKKLVVAIDKSFKRSANDDKMVVYWLSNICTLLRYLNQQADVSPSADPSLSGVQTDTTQFITESSDLADNLARELQDIVLRVYTQLVSSYRRQLVPLLLDAMLREEKTVVLNGPSPRKSSIVSPSRASSNGPVQSIGPFILQVLNMLSGAHYMLREAYVPDAVLRQFFNHILSFVDGYVLNSLLSGDEACTASTGVQMKMGVSRIDEWLSKPENQVISPTGERLNDLREAANVLVLDKSIFLDADSITAIFHSLNLVQIRKLLELFRPDGMSPTPVPSSVRKMMDAYWGYSVTPSSLSLLRDVTSLSSTF